MNLDKLRDYQVTPTLAMRAAYERWGSALNGSDMGVGKTYSTCALLRHYDAPTVVVCPVKLQETWLRAGRYMGTEFDVVGYEMLRSGRTPFGQMQNITVKGRKKLRRKFHWAPEVKQIVFDEAHRCKASSGGCNSAVMIAARRQGIPTIALTATPAVTPFDMRALGYLLHLHGGGNFYNWLGRYNCRKDWTGHMEFCGTREEKEAVMQRLRSQIFPEHGVRQCKSEIPGFPTMQIIPELYSFDTPLMASLYADMQAELAALAERKEGDIDPEAAVTKILRLREEIELMKLPVFRELVWDSVEQGRSAIVFLNFRSSVAALSKRLSHIPHETLVGGMTQRTAQFAIDCFQKNHTRAMLTLPSIGGVGLSFHDLTGEFPRDSYVSPGWSAQEFEQLTGRTCRDGAKSHSVIRVAFAAGTVEEHVFRRLSDSLSTMSALVDTDFIPFREKYDLRRISAGLKKDVDFIPDDLVTSPPVDEKPTYEYDPDEVPF
jgi:hypothetical protein